jgi:hypothetical protein
MKISVDYGFRTFGAHPKYQYEISVDRPDDDRNISVSFWLQGTKQSAGTLSVEPNTARWLGLALIEASSRKKFEKNAKVVNDRIIPLTRTKQVAQLIVPPNKESGA